MAEEDAAEIEAYGREIIEIVDELKESNAQVRELRKRKVELENLIKEFCEARDLPGIKIDGYAFVIDTKPKRGRKKKAEKKQDILEVLSELGLDDLKKEEYFEKIEDALKGPEEEVETLKLGKVNGKTD